MASNYTLFSTAVEYEKGEQETWVRELMEALDRMEYEDWSDADTALVAGILDVDVDDLYGVPQWDIQDAAFVLYSEESANLELTASIFQAFLAEFLPDDCIILSWAETCSNSRPGEFGGGAMLITANDIELFDPTQQANNKAIAYRKSKSKLVEFGSFEEDEVRLKYWWVSILGTVAKQWTFPSPVTKAGALKHVETKSPRARGDIQIFDKDPQ